MTTKNENLIHVKLEYLEAVETKRDILSSQRDLLRILKHLKNYHIIRSQELKLKVKLLKKIKELKSNISKLQKVMPEVKIPSIISHEEPEKKETKVKKNFHDNDLEYQLQEIQNKLKDLE